MKKRSSKKKRNQRDGGTGMSSFLDDDTICPSPPNKNITSFNIPDGVETIEDYTFQDCLLQSITIPESVTFIGKDAFKGCRHLKKITFIVRNINNSNESFNFKRENNIILYGTLKYWKLIGDIEKVKRLEYIITRLLGDYEFRYEFSDLTNPRLEKERIEFTIKKAVAPKDKNITSIEIPEGVEIIDNDTFKDFKLLQSIIISESVTFIGNSAFYGCSSLKSIKISENVTFIGNSAFYCCSSLKSIIITEGVTSIGQRAFSGCKALESIKILGRVTSIGERAFSSCSSLKSIIIPEGVTSIGQRAFSDCEALKSIKIPESVTNISSDTFSGCKALESIIISESVTFIGENAFYDCSSLKSIKIPGVTHIEIWAFENCKALESITISKDLSIKNNSFYGCEKLKVIHISLPDNKQLHFKKLNYEKTIQYFPFNDDEKSKSIVTKLFNSIVTPPFYQEFNFEYYNKDYEMLSKLIQKDKKKEVVLSYNNIDLPVVVNDIIKEFDGNKKKKRSSKRKRRSSKKKRSSKKRRSSKKKRSSKRNK